MSGAWHGCTTGSSGWRRRVGYSTVARPLSGDVVESEAVNLAPRSGRFCQRFYSRRDADRNQPTTLRASNAVATRGKALPDQWTAVTEIGWACRSIKVRMPRGLTRVT
jgi:hypothetical protein